MGLQVLEPVDMGDKGLVAFGNADIVATPARTLDNWPMGTPVLLAPVITKGPYAPAYRPTARAPDPPANTVLLLPVLADDRVVIEDLAELGQYLEEPLAGILAGNPPTPAFFELPDRDLEVPEVRFNVHGKTPDPCE